MRLLQLKANNPGFKTIDFNPTGLSLIVGRRHSSDQQNRKNTYNSVGKSLSIALVHFCLGSQRNSEFESKLKDWDFTLIFKIEEETFEITRSCSNQSVVTLNEKEYTLDEYKELLALRIFRIPPETKFLSFRSLISRFVRPQKSSYNSYNQYINEEQDFNALINNAFLLGLDISLILKKYDLKDQYDSIEKMRKAVEHDPIMKSFFDSEDDDDFEIDIVDLKEKIKKLEKSLSEFRVAEDYYQVVKEADDLKYRLRKLENEAANLKVTISNINASINITPDIPRKRIIDLYREAQVTLPDSVIKKLEDVENFNKKLIDDRTLRLAKEKLSFEKRLSDIEKTITKLGREKDVKLEYLNTRGALDEFTKMNEQLTSFKTRLDSIEKYKKLKQEYKNRIEELKKDFSDQNIITTNYLAKNDSLLETNILIFKNLASQFYENKRAGIEIKNNDGINKSRFEIRAKIDDDKGDGVNDVKIFCFDWTILLAGHNHMVKFLFHDSRLLSEIDTRQVATLFKVAYDNTVGNNLQYIISVNQNTLSSIKDELQDEEYTAIIENNIVLELTDESNDSKLLGMQIDLDYDKE
jgi:uncharacterized protein YydD (DUF2326 family)